MPICGNAALSPAIIIESCSPKADYHNVKRSWVEDFLVFGAKLVKGVRKGQQAEKVQRAATSGKSTESNAILPRCSPGWPKRSLRTEKTPT